MRALPLVCLALGFAIPAGAQEAPPAPTTTAGGAAAGAAEVAPTRSVGDYAGVTPAGTVTPPGTRRLARRRRRARSVILTWPGFAQRPDGGTRFFLQMTEPVQPEVELEPRRVVLRFPGTTVHLANSRRWLETRFFNTPVQRARLERRGRDMAFVMLLRADAVPRVTRQPSPDGAFHYVFVDFPPGVYVESAPGPAAGMAPADRALQPQSPPPRSGPRPAGPAPARARPMDPGLDAQTLEAMDEEAPPPVDLDR